MAMFMFPKVHIFPSNLTFLLCLAVLVLFRVALTSTPSENDGSCAAESDGICSQKKSSKSPTTKLYRKLVPSLQEWFTKADEQYISNDVHRLVDHFPIDPISSNYVREVRDALFSVTMPEPFKTSVKLAGVSSGVLLDILDLDVTAAESQDFIKYVSGSLTMPGYKPLSHRYGGHQFGYWADQLGDGRAVMIGEYMNSHGERWELQLKGSGKTPYSRRGDGRAVIRSSVREFLCSEAMHYLGVPTSRGASLVVSKDPVMRDQFYDGHPRAERGTVVLRLAKSWFRIGSLEILAFKNEINLLKQLADYVIGEHFPGIDTNSQDKYLTFFSEVVDRTAYLIAKWQSFGFAHGVLNTDNFSLLGITIDYGPFGFLDEYNPDFVPNTSDDEARYSFRKQPDVGLFNLQKLGVALEPILTAKQQKQLEIILKGYKHLYKDYFLKNFRAKLGLIGSDENDEKLIKQLLKILKVTKGDFTMTFRQLGDLTIEELKSGKISKDLWAVAKLVTYEDFSGWLGLYVKRLEQSGISDASRTELMHQHNPRYVLRNWIAQSVIQQVEKDNFEGLHKLLNILKSPFSEQPEAESLGYAAPPPWWAGQLKVSCSS